MMIVMSCLFMMYFGMKLFFLNKSHLLLMLMSLEYMGLIIILMLVNLLNLFEYDFLLLIYFMVILVCEAVLGLILLTLAVRCHGSDYLKSVIFVAC